MKTMSEERAQYATSPSGNTLYPNTFQHHNFYVDELMYLLTPEEYKVLTFALREIMGWEDKRESHKARIALSCFVEGYQTPHGKRLSYGTGLSMNTVKDCLAALCLYRVLIRHDTHPRDGTEYELNFSRQEIDVLGLAKRRLDAEGKAKTRATKAAISRKAKRGVSSDDNSEEIRVSCDDSLGGSSDDSLGGMSDDTNETKETHETHKGDSKTESPAPDKKEPEEQTTTNARRHKVINPLPPSVKVFQDVREHYPPRETWGLIEQAVGVDPPKLELWRSVLVGYAAMGWNRQSVTGPLEWFGRGQIPKLNGNGHKDMTGDSLSMLPNLGAG